MTAAASAVSIYDAIPEAEKRKWEAERKLVREGIRRAKSMPRRDRECLMFLTNLWFYHRNGDGFIHPGATMVAEKLECCLRTAKAILNRLRAGGYLVVVAYPKGGRRATWYAVDVGKILLDFHARPRGYGEHWDEAIDRSNRLLNRAKEAANRAKTAHGIQKKRIDKPLPEVFGDVSDWVDVPF
jgi:hypothetical protein